MVTPVNTPFIVLFQDDIHEVIFKNMKATTLDQYFSYLENLFTTTPLEQRVNVLLNASSGLPSFKNLAARDRAVRAKFKRVPFLRLAVLYESDSHLYFINTMLRVINVNRHMEIQIFHTRDKETAVAWLRR